MTGLDMTTILTALAVFLGGGALGYAHFATLAVVTRLLLGGNLWGVALQLGRLAVLGLALWGFATLGAAALIAGALGVLVARGRVLSRVRSAT